MRKFLLTISTTAILSSLATTLVVTRFTSGREHSSVASKPHRQTLEDFPGLDEDQQIAVKFFMDSSNYQGYKFFRIISISKTKSPNWPGKSNVNLVLIKTEEQKESDLHVYPNAYMVMVTNHRTPGVFDIAGQSPQDVESMFEKQ